MYATLTVFVASLLDSTSFELLSFHTILAIVCHVIRIVSQSGRTPLIGAIMSGSAQSVAILVEKYLALAMENVRLEL